MNIAFDPWVPVVTLSGELKTISLRDVLVEGEKFADLAVRPHERVSLMRLFLCVAHASLNGPKNYDEWCKVPKRLPDEVEKYLGKWAGRTEEGGEDCFELFHKERPWLQVAKLDVVPSIVITKSLFEEAGFDWNDISKKLIDEKLAKKKNKSEITLTTNLDQEKDVVCKILGEKLQKFMLVLQQSSTENNEDSDDEQGWSSLNKLCFTRASGQNTTLFDHESNGGGFTEYNDAQIVLNLLTFQNFFVAGGKASSRMWGDVEMKNPPNPKGGPCAGKSILFTFLRGQNLFESVVLNLNTYEDLKLLYDDSRDWTGKPLWEMPVQSPTDSDAIENATQTHIGRLVPQTRMLRINEDRKRVLLGPGFLYPKFQDEKNTFYPDAFATLVPNKNDGERQLLSARPNSFVWRELHSLTVCRKNVAVSCRGPLCLLNSPDNSPCDIIVSAMITDPKKAADIVDLIESVFHIPSKLRSDEGAEAYKEEVKTCEARAGRLGWSVEEYRKEVDGYWPRRVDMAKQDKWTLKAQLHSIATIQYWTTVEKNLSLLMNHIEAIGTDNAIPTRELWRKMLFFAACDAYRVACGQETPRQVRAFAKGWQKLTSRKNETESETIETKEENHELAS